MEKKRRGPGRPPGSKNKKKKKTISTKENSPRMKDVKSDDNHKSKINPKVVDEIWAIIFFALGAFLIVALFTGGAGQFGEIVSNGIKGLLGFVANIVPFYFIIIGVLLFSGKAVHLNLKSILLIIGILICFATLNSTQFITDTSVFDVKSFYYLGIKLQSGGLLGMCFAFVFNKLFGQIGLWVITIALLIIFILLIINTPMSEFAKKRKETKQKKKENKQEQKNHENREVVKLVEDEASLSQKETEMTTQIHLYNHENSATNSKSTDEDEFLDIVKNEGPQEDTQIKSKSTKSKGLELEDKLSSNDFNPNPIYENYKFPETNLLEKTPNQNVNENKNTLNAKVQALEDTMRNFNVDAHVVNVTQGPTVTRFEIQPNTGVKVSRIVGLADDIALNLRAKSIRIEAPIPGKAAVGVEVENENTNIVMLREIIESREFKSSKSKISFGLGRDIAGKPIISDLKSMPHLLIAGATGSGKSVCINTIITSILYKALPDEVKLILIDPKVVELGNYNGIPHLLIPVVTDPNKAAAALNWAVAEMTSRYKKFAEIGVKNLATYNEKISTMKFEEGEEPLQKMPQIVIIIDELADLMMAARKQVEDSICRLAQLARAAGMHLVVATQRPSVNVVTGVIKANIPARIAFAVSSYHDSQTIMDTGGAESLVGNGDMLYMPSGGSAIRVQGAFVSEKEVDRVIKSIVKQCKDVEYSDNVIQAIESPSGIEVSKNDEEDELMEEAIAHVLKAGQASVSMLQRRFRIGYNRAARIIDDMEARGIIGPSDGSRPRQVLISEKEYYNNEGEE